MLCCAVTVDFTAVLVQPLLNFKNTDQHMIPSYEFRPLLVQEIFHILIAWMERIGLGVMNGRISLTLDMRLFPPDGIQHLLGFLHAALADLDFSCLHRLLGNIDLFLTYRDANGLTLPDGRCVSYPTRGRMALDIDFFMHHRHIERLLLGYDLLAQLNLSCLHRALVDLQLLLTQLYAPLSLSVGHCLLRSGTCGRSGVGCLRHGACGGIIIGSLRSALIRSIASITSQGCTRLLQFAGISIGHRDNAATSLILLLIVAGILGGHAYSDEILVDVIGRRVFSGKQALKTGEQ